MGFVKRPDEIAQDRARAEPCRGRQRRDAVGRLPRPSRASSSRSCRRRSQPAEEPRDHRDGRTLAVQLRRGTSSAARSTWPRGTTAWTATYVLAMYMDGGQPDHLRARSVRRAQEARDGATSIGTATSSPATSTATARGSSSCTRRVSKDLGPFEAEGYKFNFKARPSRGRHRAARRTRSSRGRSSTCRPSPRGRAADR